LVRGKEPQWGEIRSATFGQEDLVTMSGGKEDPQTKTNGPSKKWGDFSRFWSVWDT